jgi:effector-binding domain-containing protein
MTVTPTIVERAAQPYVAIRRTVTMATFPEIADRMPEVFSWIGARGMRPSGAPFFRFNVIDMARELEVEAGVPVAAPVEPDGEILVATLPPGRYVTATHVGHPDTLVPFTAEVLDWAAGEGLTWDMTETPAGQRWGCRLVVSLTNPAEEPDPTKWVSELLFRLS